MPGAPETQNEHTSKKEAFQIAYLRRSNKRGPSNLDWLQSRHSFSFGNYYDPDHMRVSVLRVINDDQVQPGKGFGTHSHQDMELFSYVKQGSIEHKDSMGNIETLPAGEFQLMSAGTGVNAQRVQSFRQGNSVVFTNLD